MSEVTWSSYRTVREELQKYKAAFEKIYDEGLGLYADKYNWIESSMVNNNDWERDGVKLNCGKIARELQDEFEQLREERKMDG